MSANGGEIIISITQSPFISLKLHLGVLGPRWGLGGVNTFLCNLQKNKKGMVLSQTVSNYLYRSGSASSQSFAVFGQDVIGLKISNMQT